MGANFDIVLPSKESERIELLVKRSDSDPALKTDAKAKLIVLEMNAKGIMD